MGLVPVIITIIVHNYSTSCHTYTCIHLITSTPSVYDGMSALVVCVFCSVCVLFCSVCVVVSSSTGCVCV